MIYELFCCHEKNKLNDFRYPTKGFKSKIAYDIGGNLHFLDLGGVDFNRFRFSQSFFQSYDKLTLAFQLFAGRYQNNSDILTFETEKFSLGGANSLRVIMIFLSLVIIVHHSI